MLETPRSWIGWALAAAAGSAVLCLVAAPPFVGDGLKHVIMAGFSSVCHQIPDRSPFLSGVQLAVCHRCLGIYAALAAAPVVFLLLRRWDRVMQRRAGYLITFAVLIPCVDWAGDVVGAWVNTPSSRLLTGAVFGLVAGYFLTKALIGVTSAREEAML